MGKRKIAVIGVGKIAIDQHLPVIDASEDFELAATVSSRGVSHNGLPVFRTAAELYAAMPEIGLVSICTPPGVRHTLVREALDAGKDVMMEKPPTTTISELDDLIAHAKRLDRVLFQTWHSQYNAAVDRTKALLAEQGVKSVRIDWRESVRKWHPGQDWVWEPGGFGVCDPGINAFSIFTKIMPFPVFVESANLTFPANKMTPVDVEIGFKSGQAHKPALSAGFNWLEESGEIWTVHVVTGTGNDIKLEGGGRRLIVNGQLILEHGDAEYAGIYDRFADLLDQHESDVDAAPLRLMSDVFLLGARTNGPAFSW
ncbi:MULTISPECIES: Gfo/Idh/MocA family oxidoreductase [unclassified Devosia]|uniref:Gfo/Idh/MocA family protein n=1 Tax=unclassified Devosia TaxID=196773 RepID=UPI00145C8017|nr:MULTISPECIES: Gfo/Idh/MocA family oxidoreductase [unclassified Devosia]MBJ6989074.1 Gfo/Idh/MocA family oxidoreductase [Devosia sp. MC521]QMW62917.1 Gfo/Idh/MocA family oxidoreductase [Devosia sp. MC521]